MAIKISQLPQLALGNIRDNDVLPIVDAATLGTKKIAISDIKSYAVGGLSTVAISGSYNDLLNVPSVFPIPTASANTLGGIKVGAFLAVDINGVLSATPGFTTINAGNTQLTSEIGALNILAGNNITLDVNALTNSITINSSGGGGGGGSGSVGNGTTGTLSVYFTKNNVTGTNITSDGDSLVVPGQLTASGIQVNSITATSIVTTIGDLVLNPASNVSANGKRVINLSSPVGANDAATKAYVDGVSSRAFGKIGVAGQGLVSASSGTDTLNFVAGNNVTLTTNPATKSVSISVNNTLSFTILPASTSSIGGIIVGSGLSIDGNGVLSSLATALTTATTSTVGGIKVGTGLAISGDGTLSSAAAFTLNTATSSVLGGIIVGFGLNVDKNGVLSVPTQVLTTATKYILGGVKIGNSISASVDGTIDVNAANISTATTSTVGVVKPGYGLSIDSTGALNLGVNGNFTITGNLAVNGVISATNIFTTGTSVTIISSANDLQLRASGSVITNTTLWVNTTTPATSTSSGALEVSGGIAIGKNFIAGNDSIINGVVFGAGGGSAPYNIAIGSGALQNNSGAQFLTAVGFNALSNANANNNTALGYNAGVSVVSGSNNTLIGISAGSGLVSGTFNSALGHQSYVGQGASSYNTVLGGNINSIANQPQSYNVLVGYNIANNTSRPGSNSVAIGGNNLQATTGSNNIVIGYGAGSALTTASNQVIIGGYDGNAITALSNYISLSDGAGNLRAQWDNKGQATFFNTGTFYSTKNAVNSTNSGALIVAGGAGIGLDLYVGGTIYSQGSAVVTAATLGTPISGVIGGTDTSVVINGTIATVYSTATLQSIVQRGGGNIASPIHITSQAQTTGTSTGALIVDGSVGVAGDAYFGGKVNAGADSTASSTATSIGLFDRNRRVLTQAILIPDLGIDITTSSNTATVSAYNIKNTGVLVVTPGVDIALLSNGASSVSATGTVTISATSTLDSVTQRGATAGVPVKILSTSSVSTGSSSGGLVVTGGLGLTGALNITGSLTLNGATISTASVFNGGTITGALFVNNSTNSTSTGYTAGPAIVTAGGLGVAKDLNVGGNIYINGLQLSTSTIFNGGSITNPLNVNNATASTSTTTGAIISTGGIGIKGDVHANGFYNYNGSIIGWGPMASAYLNTTQAAIASGTPTKVQFQTKEFDTATIYDAVSTFRATPVQLGYYQVNASVQATANASGIVGVSIYKNGSAYKRGAQLTNNAAGVVPTASALVQITTSTDYIEVFFTQTTGAAMTLAASQTGTFVQISFLRGI